MGSWRTNDEAIFFILQKKKINSGLYKAWKCNSANLTSWRKASGGSLPPHFAARVRPCWHSPGHGSGHSHGPTPAGWNLRWPGCLCQNAQSGVGLREKLSVLRRAEETGNHLPNAHSKVCWTSHRAHPVPVPGLRMILQYRHLQAEGMVH